MPRYDDYDRDDDDDYDDIRVGRGRRRDRDDAPAGPKPQSGLGIASVCLAIVVFVGYFFLIATIGVIAAQNNAPMKDDDPVAVVGGLGIIGTFCLNLIGLVMGFVGCFQSDRNVLCAILGTTFNAILLFGVIALVCAGLMMGG
jgi:hypothetical protein